MSRQQKIYAVLTGDLIRSSDLSSDQSKGAMEHLRKTVDELAKQHPVKIVGHLDSFRHDSWQILMERPDLSLRVAVILRAALKMNSDAQTKYDTRISIGIGSIESISKRRISDSRGMAFTLSGKGMDSMKNRHLAFAAVHNGSVWLDSVGHGIVPLIDCVIEDWTPTESRAVYGALKGWTQEETAKKWPMQDKNDKPLTRQAVGDSLARAHWNAIDSVLLWVETQAKQDYGLA